MNNIQYPLEGSSGWGDAVNSNFHAFEDGIDDLNSNKTEILSTIGDEVMGTTATTLKGAIAEVKGIANSNTTQLNENTQNIATNTRDINTLKTTKQDKLVDTGWISATLNDGFTNRDGFPVEYRKIYNTVYIRGQINSTWTSGTWSVPFSLPSGFRPTQQHIFSFNNYKGTLNPTGDLNIVTNVTSTTYVQLCVPPFLAD